MELKIISEIQNDLFNRKEIQAIVEAEILPSKIEVSKTLAEKFSALEDAINIKNILGKFGSKEFSISANIYKSKEDKNKVEPSGKEETKPEEVAPAEQSIEVPKEEPKVEEPKTEEPKE